jgi:hypothetical protein
MYPNKQIFLYIFSLSLKSGRSWNECCIELVAAAAAVLRYVLCVQCVVTNQNNIIIFSCEAEAAASG